MIIKEVLDLEGAKELTYRLKQLAKSTKADIAFEEVKDTPTTLEGYGITNAAKKTDLTTLATKEELTTYTKKTDLNPYVKNTELASYAKNSALSDYAKTTDLDSYAKNEDLAEYITKEELEKILNPAAVGDKETLIQTIKAGKGDTVDIVLTEDIGLEANLTIPANTNVTLDLGDSTLSTEEKYIVVSGTLTITGNGTIEGIKTPLYATTGGEIILESGTIISTKSNGIEPQKGGVVTINGGLVQAQEFGIHPRYPGAIVNMNGGVVKALDNAAFGNNGSTGQGETIMNITGGRLESHIQSKGYVACGIYLANEGEVNISGGEIVAIGGCGICQRAGTINITGGTITGSGAKDLLGKVGDSRVVVGPNGIVFDQTAKYPGAGTDQENIHLNIYSGTIAGKNESIQVLKDTSYIPDINVNGGIQIPTYNEDSVI